MPTNKPVETTDIVPAAETPIDAVPDAPISAPVTDAGVQRMLDGFNDDINSRFNQFKDGVNNRISDFETRLSGMQNDRQLTGLVSVDEYNALVSRVETLESIGNDMMSNIDNLNGLSADQNASEPLTDETGKLVMTLGERLHRLEHRLGLVND